MKLLFVVIWLHISALDLFYVTYHGPVFMWQENARLETIVVHFLIALTTVAFYWLISRLFRRTKIVDQKAIHHTVKNK